MRLYPAVFILLSLHAGYGVSFTKSFQLRMNLQSSGLERYVPPLKQEEPLKILLVVEPTPFTYVSGYANRFKEALRYLHKAGDTVHVVTPDQNNDAPKDFLGYQITTLKGFAFPLYKKVIVSFDIKRAVHKILRDFRPDLTHITSPSTIGFPSIGWALFNDVPLVISYHTNIVEYARIYTKTEAGVRLAKWLVSTFHAYADLNLCTSPQLKEDLEGLGLTNVDVWQKGINTERFSASYRDAAMRDNLCQGRSESPLLLYVGRLGMEKRLDRIKKVLDANPTARLALVGAGPARAELEKIYKDYPVHFVGELSGDALSQAYASCDVFVMPSDSETLGFVVLEAMASSVPVVAVAAGGLVDLIKNGENGYLVSNDDGMDEFVKRTNELIESPELRASMGQAGRKWAETLSWESATSILRNVQYRAAISNHRKKRERQARERQARKQAFTLEAADGNREYTYRPDMS